MTGLSKAVRFDERGVASLDGRWEFYPGDHDLAELERLEPEAIDVPALWEAEGWLELDGWAWYRRPFALDPTGWFWTLRFGAVMDVAEVYVNGELLGSNDSPFTPFEVDVTASLVEGDNIVAVRVFDPPLDDPEHARLPHGKQGWANHHFPSRPSLYMTYGGIWQPVTLRRHGPLVVRDVFVVPDPDDARVTVEVENRSTAPQRGRLGVRALGRVWEQEIAVEAGAADTRTARLGATDAERWTPESPVLHDVLADVVLDDGNLTDARTARFGLRTIGIDGDQMLLNGTPYRMKSVLVQGFTAERLYAEGSREEIEDEVRAARELGFNTLRLHIKGFDPLYLDVCDELGMLLHCDLPVAEPIAHDELGDDTELARRCSAAVERQIRRDRNHPSIVLWSAMNELCLDRLEARYTEGYERFARALADVVERTDPTRPYIENDWIEPEPERVFRAPVLTAHWYGRLHAEYLEKLERQCAAADGLGKPLFVTEYGDWGLPEMPELAEPPFWDTREVYAGGLAKTLWPGTVPRFVRETQRYQGLSDRLQTEVFRRHGHIGGYCLTELTDVPHELNGLLDLRRKPKPMAVAEMKRANQTVLPMLRLDSLVVHAGSEVTAPLCIANDGPPLDDVDVEARFGDSVGARSSEDLLALDGSRLDESLIEERFPESVSGIRVGDLPAFEPLEAGRIALTAPEVPGSHDLVLLVRSRGELVAENRYPIHVVRRPRAAPAARVVAGSSPTEDALASVGAASGEGPLVVPEQALDATTGAEAAAALAAGETVLILAQSDEAAPHFPVPTELAPVATKWGSSVFHFTRDDGIVTSLPRRSVLAAEDSTVQARSIVTTIDGGLFPDTPVVIAYKPVPAALTGTVVGAHRVGNGCLIFCQYRLVEPARAGDAAAQSLLSDLLAWASAPRRVLAVDEAATGDGRPVRFYSFGRAAA